MLFCFFTWTKITGKFGSSKLAHILMFPETKNKVLLTYLNTPTLFYDYQYDSGYWKYVIMKKKPLLPRPDSNTNCVMLMSTEM